jgi:hypothetical protein
MVQGTVLVDTGLDFAYIRMPKESYASVPNEVYVTDAAKNKTVNVLPKGTVVTTSLSAPCNASVAGSYTFTVGGTDEVEPKYTRPLEFVPEDGSYVNTGKNFIKGFDVSYDPVNGRYGLRKVGEANGLGMALSAT